MSYKFIFRLLKPILNRNKIFENKFRGEDVFIFGNGVSLKNYDLNYFKDKNILSCGYFFLNNSFEGMNSCAHIEIDPFILYPLEKHKFSNKLQKNFIRDIYYNNFPLNKIPLITSITNLLAFKKFSNIFFTHHFGTNKQDFDINHIDISNKMMFMNGSMYFLIALSKYMGFKQIYLVGMDYINTIPENGHFYEFGKGKEFTHSREYLIFNEKFFKFFKNYLDISVINKRNKIASCGLNNLFYEDFFYTKEIYFENTDICSKEGLDLLHSMSKLYVPYAKDIYKSSK
jgi:hypothetical protein